MLETAEIAPYGVNRDLSPNTSGPVQWAEAKGVIFRRNRTERADTHQFHDPDPVVKPERLHYREFNGTYQWLYSGPDGIGLNVGGSANNISPAGWTPVSSGRQTWCSLNSIPVYNHPERTPLYHGGTPNAAMVDLPGWVTADRCAVMRSFSFYLLAMDYTDENGNYDNMVRWSAAADPGNVPSTWTPAANNDAGALILASRPGAIIDGAALRDEFMVYKHASTYSLRYIGGVWVFRQRKVFTTLGILARGCVSEWQGRHFLVGEGDIVVHDGVNTDPVADKVVRQTIFDDLHPVHYLNACFVLHDVYNKQMQFYWPSANSTGYCDRVASYNYVDRTWTLENIALPVAHGHLGRYNITGVGNTWAEPAGVTWANDHGIWNEGSGRAGNDQVMLAVPSSVKLQERLRHGQAGNTTAVASSLTLLHQDLDRADRYKMVDRVWLVGNASQAVDWTVQLGVAESPDAAITWGPEQTVQMTGGAPVAVDGLLKGRYLSARLGCTTAAQWSLDKLVVDHRLKGRFG